MKTGPRQCAYTYKKYCSTGCKSEHSAHMNTHTHGIHTHTQHTDLQCRAHQLCAPRESFKSPNIKNR